MAGGDKGLNEKGKKKQTEMIKKNQEQKNKQRNKDREDAKLA